MTNKNIPLRLNYDDINDITGEWIEKTYLPYIVQQYAKYEEACEQSNTVELQNFLEIEHIEYMVRIIEGYCAGEKGIKNIFGTKNKPGNKALKITRDRDEEIKSLIRKLRTIEKYPYDAIITEIKEKYGLSEKRIKHLYSEEFQYDKDFLPLNNHK
jgi:hypothetical protein